MTAPVRVLAVTSEPPWPLNSGGHIRTYHLLKALAAGTELRIVCPLQDVHQADCDSLRAQNFTINAPLVGSRTRVGEGTRLIGAIVHNEPYVMYRRHFWSDLAAVWASELRGFRPDVVYLDHLDSFLYRRLASQVPAVIDLHNVYSLLARRTADEQLGPLKRTFLRREARLLEKMERRAVRDCTALFAVSRQEADHFRSVGAKGVHVAPNGVDCAALADLPTGRRAHPPVILFLGTMSWGPNASAARFLAVDVMPRLRLRFPSARLLVVGRGPPANLLALSGQDGVEVTGGVPDVKPYLLEANVMAVPLDAGGGTRLKILEAFAAGLPVVSTAVGAEGIDATPGEHLIVAERAGFIDAVADLLATPDRATQLATVARELAREVYDWGRIGRSAVEVVRGLAATRSPAR